MPYESFNTPQITKIDKDLFSVRWSYRETKITLKITGVSTGVETINRIYEARRALDTYSRIHPEFFKSLFPVDPKPSAPEVAFLMAEAASKADVGPLAAVAGALVDVAVKDVDASYILLENGGEVYARVDRPAIVGIHAGSSPFSGKILLSVNEGECPIGVGTSSASVGHAVTFGEADAATAVADDTALADAAATAICNKVEGSTIEYSLRNGVEAAKKIQDIRGTLIIRGHHMIAWGRLPRLSMDNPPEIT